MAERNRRSASFVIPRSLSPTPPTATMGSKSDSHSRSHRMSLSPWRSRPKTTEDTTDHHHLRRASSPVEPVVTEKKSLWSWKVMRALSRIGMHRVCCLFSIEVITIQNLPVSMNGLRLAIAVRKKESKDGCVRTMPVRVLQRSADFDETLFIRCHIYCTGGVGTGKPLKIEPRQFVVAAEAVDAPELDLGKSNVDLSDLVKESIDRSLEGDPVRQWDAVLKLTGKAKGADLVLKLGFQIMEDGGLTIYSKPEETKLVDKGSISSSSSSSYSWRQSKSSFSIGSIQSMRLESSQAPSSEVLEIDIDDFYSTPFTQKSEPELKVDDLDCPEFEVVEKGIEIQTDGQKKTLTSCKNDAVEITMTRDATDTALDVQEELVTTEFLQRLNLESSEQKTETSDPATPLESDATANQVKESESMVFLSELGKGLGSVIQTRDGGYMASLNPFGVEVSREEVPKLAIQISRPFVLCDHELRSGLELFQRMAAMGSEKLISELLSLAALDELMGKTAEQIAFEGIASAIINGRNKEGASSNAARSIAITKEMAKSMNEGKRERILTGVWSVDLKPIKIENILTFSLQKIETMAVEALKIQAEMADEEAPFDVSPLISEGSTQNPLSLFVPLEDAEKTGKIATNVMLLVVVQLRDPMRQYEAVGAPVTAVVQATQVESREENEDVSFKVTGLHIGGLTMLPRGPKCIWDSEKQRLTAMQWLSTHGLGKACKKQKKPAPVKGGQDLLWSVSSRVMADLWLKHIRNPNVKIAHK
ncbi:putative NT-type C2 domain, protein PLASTID MOVEMENT IMPAIRED 1 [Dioscorea sansibarensis]